MKELVRQRATVSFALLLIVTLVSFWLTVGHGGNALNEGPVDRVDAGDSARLHQGAVGDARLHGVEVGAASSSEPCTKVWGVGVAGGADRDCVAGELNHPVCCDESVSESGTRDGENALHASDKLVAAAEEFIDRGEIGQVTVGAIADAAGVHRVTFYRHYPDKESLIVEVLERRSAPVLEHAVQTLESGSFFPDTLIESMATAIVEARARPGMLAALGVYPTDGVPNSAGMSARFLQRAVDITAPHVAAAQEAGLLRSDLTAEEIVQWLLEVCLSSLVFRPDDSAEDVRRHLFTFVVPAIGAGSG